MILVAVGTQKFPFDRLLKELDQLMKSGVIHEKIVAQIGYSGYCPCHYPFFKFVEEPDFLKLLSECDILITHGGVGTICQGLSQKKRVLIVPRRKKYGEHVDDHQMEIAKRFEELGYAISCYNMKQLGAAFETVQKKELKEFHFSYLHTAQYIQKYLETIEDS